MLELRGVTASYGSVEAVRNLSIVVPEGTTVALLGRNGAGKTTTLRVVSGVVRPVRGEVWFEGERIDGRRPEEIAKRGIAHVPEGRRVFPGLTVVDNLASGVYWRRLPRVDVRRETDRVLEFFPALQKYRKQTAGSLSGGEQQMVAMARALIGRPKVLIVDEPSLGLSPVLTEGLYDRLHVLNAQEGLTILLVEQYVDLALEVASYAYVLEKGETVLEGAAGELRSHPEVVSAYVG
ncbi:MAG TPA: ABC transporter ATP-binding protein [Acidimicrobiia bacterium]|nr:ABC transporter ATP-binding protein [Acidimicrobiia bacterium]